MNRLQKIAIALVILVVGAASYGRLAKRNLASLAPTSDHVSFDTFADEMPPPRILTHVRLRDGDERIVWGGEIANIMASGGSCYIFDESGTLVEWSPTTGDGESIDNIWRQVVDEKPVTVDDVKAMINAG